MGIESMTLGLKLERYAHTLPIFHHFPIANYLTTSKCRQFSVLGFTIGSVSAWPDQVRRPRRAKSPHFREFSNRTITDDPARHWKSLICLY